MVINGLWKGSNLTFSKKPNCLTLSYDQEKWTNVFSFDNAGRLWTAMLEGISYRRGLDGKIVAKWKGAFGQPERRWLTSDEADRLLAQIHELVTELWQSIQTATDIQLPQSLTGEILHALDKASKFSLENFYLDVAEFNKVYKPIGILPPDQYMALVLQMTEGCSYNACSFCSFYRDRPFKIKSLQEFLTHIQSVKQFLGEGVSLRRTIFLGDANALVIPINKLVPLLEVVHNQISVDKAGGMYAFLDGFSADKKTPQDYYKLAQLGLKRIYIGLESGNAPLIEFLQKPGSPRDVLQAVKAIKAGGISVGIIILLGAGGHKYYRSHVSDTIKIINEMCLDMDDLIYFSDLVESEGLTYVKNAFQAEMLPLTFDELQSQANQIRKGLRFSATGGTPHISRYDIREFVY